MLAIVTKPIAEQRGDEHRDLDRQDAALAKTAGPDAIIGWKTAQIVTSQNACDWRQWLCDCSVSAAAP